MARAGYGRFQGRRATSTSEGSVTRAGGASGAKWARVMCAVWGQYARVPCQPRSETDGSPCATYATTRASLRPTGWVCTAKLGLASPW
jgi:hypothetical protein